MNPYSLSVLLFAFGVVLISVLAIVKDPSRITLRFAGFSAAVSLWAFFYIAWTGYERSPEECLKLIRISEAFAVLIPPLWLHFALEFVGYKSRWRWDIPAHYGASLIFLAFCPTPYFFKGVREVPVFGLYKDGGVVFYAFFIFFCLCVFRAFTEMTRAYLKAEGPKKEQLRYLLIGWGAAFFGGTATFLPAMGITDFYYLFFLMPLYSVFLGIVLTQYGYLDLTKITEAFHKDKLAAIGTLSACINHEIRNPVYIIGGVAQVYLEGNPDHQKDLAVAKSMRTIADQSRRALEIMKNLSDFTRQEIGGSRPPKDLVCVRRALSGVKSLIQHELETSEIKLHEEIPENLSNVHINKGHFEEILFNLLLNASQAVKRCAEVSSRKEIHIQAVQKNGSVILEIRDTGPGISETHLSKIFEPFYTTKESGAGLGLFITKRLIERNGGKIFVHSQQGEGTTFRLTISRA